MKEHIWFRRILKHIFKVFLNTLMIFMIYWLTKPIRKGIILLCTPDADPALFVARSAFAVLDSPAEFVMLIVFSIAGGIFLAADEAIKLVNNYEARVCFLNETPENTFDFRRECIFLASTDVYWNDVFAVFITELITLGFLKMTTWLWVMLDDQLLEKQQDIRYAFLSGAYSKMFFLIIVFYIISHVLLSAYIHYRWDRERAKRTDTAETTQEKRHANI